MVSVDVLDRTIDPSTGVVRTERVLGCKQSAPRWVVKVSLLDLWSVLCAKGNLTQMLGGSDDAFVREVSFVDPSTSRTTITSVNLSLSQYITVLEQITYEPSQTSPLSRTSFRQTAEIQARLGLWKTVSDRLESWSVERFTSNAQKGREGFEGVLRALWERRHGEMQQLEA